MSKEHRKLNKLLRLPDVLEKTGLCRSNLYRLMQSGDFPQKVELGPKSVAWVSSEVDAWICNQIERRNNKQGVSKNGN